MDMKNLIAEIIDAGYSEARIAQEVGVKTSQSTIHRIKAGTRKSVRFELGMAIIELHKRVIPESAKNVDTEPS